MVKSKLVKISLSPTWCVYVITTTSLAKILAHTSLTNTYPTPKLITMANTTAPQRQIGTWASNKTAHPGNADKSHGRRSSAEVQKERTAKAQAKAAREEAKQNSINRTAEFELADIAEEGLADATPRPPFTPKQWPPPRNQTYSDLTPLAAMSDDDMSEDFDRASFVPPRSEMSATADDSAVESEAPTPAPKKQKTQDKAAVKTAAKTTVKKAGGKKHVDEPDVEMVPSKVEPPQEPKAKKAKKKMVREEINKRIEGNANSGNKYGDMMRAMQRAREEGSNGEPALKAHVKLQAAGGNKRGLKREGAIGDIETLFDEDITVTNPDQLSKRSDWNNNNET